MGGGEQAADGGGGDPGTGRNGVAGMNLARARAVRNAAEIKGKPMTRIRISGKQMVRTH